MAVQSYLIYYCTNDVIVTGKLENSPAQRRTGFTRPGLVYGWMYVVGLIGKKVISSPAVFGQVLRVAPGDQEAVWRAYAGVS